MSLEFSVQMTRIRGGAASESRRILSPLAPHARSTKSRLPVKAGGGRETGRALRTVWRAENMCTLPVLPSLGFLVELPSSTHNTCIIA